MKQFLYLDTDIVNSIIAQSEKGLIQEQSEENGSDKKKGTHISGSMEGSGTAGGSFLKLAKAEANLSLSGELGKEYVSSTTSREIISNELCWHRHFQRQKHGCRHAPLRRGRHLAL